VPAQEQFGYQIVKSGSVLVFFKGRHVVTVAGADADKLRSRIDAADDAGVQLALAKATRNFKHGNEGRR
jgi:hypothetical protein